ncbi:MAG: class I SAM-dependent methyltransferase [Myxococcota bacterium]|nr:class I SAM-dependent methyltransferase [Myxococcota bacterium]
MAERTQARVFGEVARLYDAVRPSYPPALVEDVLAFAGLVLPGRILEIGAGTGKATLPFARRGHRVHALEPDAAMAEVARERCAGLDVTVEVRSFEDAALPEAGFDLVIAAQSFHWVDAGADARLAAVLRDGGAVALFWNQPRTGGTDHDPLRRALDAAYAREAPALGRAVPPGGRASRQAVPVERLAATGAFAPPVEHRHPWAARYPTARYLRLMETQSDHRMLDADARRRLYEALRRAVDAHGGVVPVTYDARVVMARRLPRGGGNGAPAAASPRGAGV